jgi:Zn-finger nucleic acid-binding protein
MKCPNCNETLVMADRQGIEIDYCPACRGVWLDKGELDKIVERSGQIQYGDQSQADYYDRRDDDYYKKHPNYPRKKKRGFLGDFFDFD